MEGVGGPNPPRCRKKTRPAAPEQGWKATREGGSRAWGSRGSPDRFWIWQSAHWTGGLESGALVDMCVCFSPSTPRVSETPKGGSCPGVLGVWMNTESVVRRGERASPPRGKCGPQEHCGTEQASNSTSRNEKTPIKSQKVAFFNLRVAEAWIRTP